MNRKNSLFTSNETIIALIVIFTFLIFAIAGYGWHFYKEEIDLLYAASKIKSFKDLLSCFLSGNVSGNAHPTNYIPPPLTFLTSFYRPLLFIFAFIQYTLIGMQPYVYYLISIGLHCLNIPLIFHLLTRFTSSSVALICTAFFAVHPAFAHWIGNANMQQYTISTTCITILALLIKKNLEGRSGQERPTLIAALLLFALTLFIRETIIATPAAFIWLSFLGFINWRKAFLLASIFTLATLPYLAAKITIFPLTLNTIQSTSFTNISAKTSLWFIQARTFIYDFLGISWLQGYPKTKGFIVLLLATAVALLFLKNSRKRHIIAALGCMVLLLWPAIMIGYFIPSRFFYEATPAYLLAIALLIDHKKQLFKKIIMIVIGGLIVGSIAYTVTTVKGRTKEPKEFYAAIMKLKNNPTIKNNPLCFFGLPETISWTGLAQQLWLYKINDNHPIFIFHQPQLQPTGTKCEKFINISQKNNYFILSSHDANKIWLSFKSVQFDDEYGTINVLEQQEKKITRLLITPKKNYFYPNTTFLMWSYRNNELTLVKRFLYYD